ncbi:MAG: SigF/SigG family RNA polymerase sporulation sigma factor [Lachnospiraceae bacterium]|nr:SigF/SigG family RNA polymerase sporulation sigma factor [Lachnospiraceae bacterium]
MEVYELITQYRQGDKTARDKLVIDNTNLVWSIVKRFKNRGYEPQDLFQTGVIGLIKAIDKFDVRFNVKFSTYAVPMITGEIKRFLRDDGMIKISRSYKELAAKVNNMKEELMKKYHRTVTIDEVSIELNIPKEDIVVALEATNEVESLYKTIGDKEGKDIMILDRIEEKEKVHENVVDRIAIKQMLEKLPELEQNIIKYRYFEDKKQKEIAEILGISQVQVSRLEKKTLKKMKDML